MTDYITGPRISGVAALAREMHRKARLPKWGGKHGSRVKGSVTWSADESGSAWVVVYSFLLGYESTTHVSERFDRWSLAIGQYREHDRMVQERKKLEDFRSVRAVL